MSLVKHILIVLIRAYQWLLSPVLPMSCRYHPSCSHYACEAIRRHGALAGIWLALGRLLRCQPWGAGGWDPVPETLGMPAGLRGLARRLRDGLSSTRAPQQPCGKS